MLRNYSSSNGHENKFIAPLNKRRKTLHFALIISTLLYSDLITLILCFYSVFDPEVAG